MASSSLERACREKELDERSEFGLLICKATPLRITRPAGRVILPLATKERC